MCYVCNSACDHCSLHVSQAATESDAYAPLPPNPYLLLLMLAHPFTLSPFHHFTLPPNIHPTSSHTHQPISPSAHHPIRPSSTGHQHPIIYGWSSVWPSTAVDIPYQTSIPPPPTSPSAHQSIIPSAHHHPPAFNTRSSTDGRRCGPPPPSISLTKHPSLLLPYPSAHPPIRPSAHPPISPSAHRPSAHHPPAINTRSSTDGRRCGPPPVHRRRYPLPNIHPSSSHTHQPISSSAHQPVYSHQPITQLTPFVGD